jgi:dUTP pyrophosphatase
MEDFKLIFTKTTDVKSPVRGHETDAGIDFFVPENFGAVTLEPGQDILIDAGIRVVVPKGYALIFKEKSGVATKRKLTIGACVVDSDYRGNVHLHLFNNGTEIQSIEAGDKITQGLVVPVSLCQTEEVSNEEYSKYEDTERGEGGFGSTGTK